MQTSMCKGQNFLKNLISEIKAIKVRIYSLNILNIFCTVLILLATHVIFINR